MLKIACQFGVSRSFVQKIIHQEEKTGSVLPLCSRGKKPKLQAYGNLIQQLLQENPEATQKQLCQLLQEKTNLETS